MLSRASATSGKRALAEAYSSIDTPSRSTSRKRIATGLSMEERAEGAGRRPGVKPTELISKASMLSAGRRTTRAVRFLARVVSGARVLIPEL